MTARPPTPEGPEDDSAAVLPEKKVAAEKPQPPEDEIANLLVIAVGAGAIASLDVGLPQFLPFVLVLLAIPIWRLLGGKSAYLVVGLLAANICMLVIHFCMDGLHAARERANTRACYANQKTIAGAVEMYNLDRMTRRSDIGRAFCEELVSRGYLQSVPNDPGQGGPESASNYSSTAGGNGIKCTIHGTIQGNS
jgi:hypothetical protein